MTGGFPSQNANNAGRVFVPWGHVSCRTQRYNFRIAKWIYLFVKQGISFPEHGKSFYGPWWSLTEESFLDPGRKMVIKSYRYYKILLKQILWHDKASTHFCHLATTQHRLLHYCFQIVHLSGCVENVNACLVHSGNGKCFASCFCETIECSLVMVLCFVML